MLVGIFVLPARNVNPIVVLGIVLKDELVKVGVGFSQYIQELREPLISEKLKSESEKEKNLTLYGSKVLYDDDNDTVGLRPR